MKQVLLSPSGMGRVPAMSNMQHGKVAQKMAVIASEGFSYAVLFEADYDGRDPYCNREQNQPRRSWEPPGYGDDD